MPIAGSYCVDSNDAGSNSVGGNSNSDEHVGNDKHVGDDEHVGGDKHVDDSEYVGGGGKCISSNLVSSDFVGEVN